jgi:hydroxymethylpyrimidine pyrophosphatase-like HAD family hydrolase|nr:hypothetical protein [Neorhizobium tomejilense]
MDHGHRPIVFTDIDDTLCQSEYRVQHGEREGMIAISRSLTGNRTCMTVKQQNMLRWLVATTELVPVTARGMADFSDISVDFGRSHKIVANGAVILGADGSHDTEWAATMAAEMAPYQDAFDEVVAVARSFCDGNGHRIRALVTSEFGMKISALFGMDGSDSSLLSEVRDAIGQLDGWHTHLNGNTLALTPPPVSKRRAVEHMLARIENAGNRPVIGLGDSLSDLGFMIGCDFISTPRGSQISAAFAM